MDIKNEQDFFPLFLQDYGSFYSHIQSQLETLIPQQKGQIFANFAQRLIRHTDIGKQFEFPEQRQTTHDGGVDLQSQSLDGEQILYVQSKYTIRDVDEIAQIFDKFQAFEKTHHSGNKADSEKSQLPLLKEESSVNQDKTLTIHYMIVTASKVLGTEKMAHFENSHRLSVEFYNTLKNESRIQILDGLKIFPIVKGAYRKQHIIPMDVTLSLASPFLKMGNVYIGIISGQFLKALYDDYYGDSLFLQNIREWLGPYSGKVPVSGRESVNQAISRTLQHEPYKLLARNNGITFRASTVKEINDNTLILDEASIVNGCQTTMSIVNETTISNDCYVLVKVVETPDAWDIAGAANFQTKVDRIDLDIAQYIRRQAISTAAVKYGVRLDNPSEETTSIFSVFDEIARAEIQEDEIRALFIGIFSRTPNNAIEVNYTELRTDILQEYGNDPNKEEILYRLFAIYEMTRKAAETVRESFPKTIEKPQIKSRVRKNSGITVGDLFQRFWKDKTKYAPNYRAFLSILAACRCVEENIYEYPDLNYTDICQFLGKVQTVIDREPQTYIQYYKKAFMSLAIKVLDTDSDVEVILKNMTQSIKTAKFNLLYIVLEAISEGQ